MAPTDPVRAWFADARSRARAEGADGVGGLVPRGSAEGIPRAEDETEPLTDLDFGVWPIPVRLVLEQELQTRNMEHLWHGARLVVPSRLEYTIDDVLDELAAAGPAAAPDTSTRWCPSCDGEFVAGIDTCPDCGVALVGSRPQSVVAGEVETRRIDLADWSEDTRYAVAHQLSGGWPLFDSGMTWAAGAIGTASYHRQLPPNLTHAWDGTTLVVPESEAEVVEAWVMGIQGAVELALDPEADKLAYDVEDMSDESLTLLLESLMTARIPHELTDDGELLVHEADEATVEGILDKIDFPDELPAQDDAELADPDDGLEAQEVLSDLFEAADRLHHDSRNPDAMLALVTGVDRMAALDVPFGFHRDQWEALVEQAAGLRSAVEEDEPDREQLADRARDLRDVLHPLV